MVSDLPAIGINLQGDFPWYWPKMYGSICAQIYCNFDHLGKSPGKCDSMFTRWPATPMFPDESILGTWLGLCEVVY